MATFRDRIYAKLAASMRNLPPSREMLFHVLQITRGPYRQPSDHRLPLDHADHHDIRVDLVCKMAQRPGSDADNCVDKFILSLPHYVIWTFPASFYALAKHIVSSSASSAANTDLLAKFLKQPIFRYVKKGSDLTNQQLITFVQYIAYNSRQHDFFSQIAKEFKSNVDGKVLNTSFDDFLLQLDVNLFNVLDLNSALSEEHAANFTFVFDQKTFRTTLGGRARGFTLRDGDLHAEPFYPYNSTIVRMSLELKRTPPTNRPQHVYDTLTSLWRSLTTPVTTKSLGEFPLNICAYDIEVGYTCSLAASPETIVPKSMPSFLNGFCQCICFKTSVFTGYVDIENARTVQFVYIPPMFDGKEFEECWHRRIRDLSYWFRNSKCVVFSREADMIQQFLSYALVRSDIIIGYNSKNFDLPFLIMRYNYLTTGRLVDIFTKNMNQYSFAYGFSAAVNNVHISKFEYRCEHCGESNNLRGVKFESAVFECSKCRQTRAIDAAMLEAMYCEVSSCRGYDQQPFIYHHDLINSQFAQKCENRKLDTVCSDTFRQVVDKTCPLVQVARDVVRIRLKRELKTEHELVELFELFVIGIRVQVFYKQHLSNNMCVIATGNVKNLLWHNDTRDGPEAEPTRFVHDDKFGVVTMKKTCAKGLTRVHLEVAFNADCMASFASKFADGGVELFVSVGKTCEISREEQMFWRTTQHIVETVFYCDVDTRLTFALECVTKGLTDILNASFLETFPFRLMQMQSGQKVTPKICRKLMSKIFLVSIANMQQIHTYFTSALEVEGVRALVPADRDQGDGILSVPAYEFAEDMMRFDQDNVNVNEWHLGTMGEFPLDDLNLLKKSLSLLTGDENKK